jgi:hypothetical protein
MSQKFLYAASVQGIQSYIFGTNELKQIIGASELVEEICTDFFRSFIKSEKEYNNGILVSSAGNIRFVFETEDKAKEVYKTLPFKLAKFAPGLSLTQTIIPFNGSLKNEHLIEAENKLQALRSSPYLPSTYTSMLAKRNPRTGQALMAGEQDDIASWKKLKSFRINLSKWPAFRTRAWEKEDIKQAAGHKARKTLQEKVLARREFKKDDKNKPYRFLTDLNKVMKESKENTWLAVIHADGNDFGKILPKFAQAVKDNEKDFHTCFRAFSQSIEKANQAAASSAFAKIYGQFLEQDPFQKEPVQQDNQQGEEDEFELEREDNIKPQLFFRPIILGGDDISVITHAPEALEFTKLYLEYFKCETKKVFGMPIEKVGISLKDIYKPLENGLTACAGIAFVKTKYPMYYAMSLAEDLCKAAKKQAKENPYKIYEEENNQIKLTPATLAFHRMEDSFFDGYQVPEDSRGNKLTGCPYFLEPVKDKEELSTVADLQERLRKLGERGSLPSRLRKVLSMLAEGDESAIEEELKRITQVVGDFKDIITQDNLHQLYDLLTLHALSKNSQLPAQSSNLTQKQEA